MNHPSQATHREWRRPPKSRRRRLHVESLEQRLALSGISTASGGGALGALGQVDRTIGFEVIGTALAVEGAWNGPDAQGQQREGIDGDTISVGSFTEQDVSFSNIFSHDFESWNGWAYSNKTDSTTPGFGNQLSAFPGSGAEGSATYAVAFRDTREGVPWEDTYPLPHLQLGSSAEDLSFQSVMVANTTYSALAIRDGDSFTEKFGGLSGDDPDWFLLTIAGTDAEGEAVGEIEFYLADYRFADNSQDYVVDDWQPVDLTALSDAAELAFRITSSDVGLFGINTPAYFALDNLVLTQKPEVPLSVTALTETSSGFEATLSQPLDRTSLNLVDTATGLLGEADVVVIGEVNGPVAGSLTVSPAGDSLAFVKSGTPLAPDTYTVRIRGGENGLRSLDGGPLDGNADGEPGDDFFASFAVAAANPDELTVGIPDFVRGPGQAVNLPADSAAGIPITVSKGTGVRSIDMQLRYDATTLQITDAHVSAAVPDGATVELIHSAPGQATIRFNSPSDLPAGPSQIVSLTATIPSDEASLIYGSVGLLDLHSIIARNAAEDMLPVTDDDAIHVISYFGDTSGNGRVNAADASLVARVAAFVDGGFASLAAVDPVVVADVTGNGRLNAVDASRIAQFAAQIPVAEIPSIPATVVIDAARGIEQPQREQQTVAPTVALARAGTSNPHRANCDQTHLFEPSTARKLEALDKLLSTLGNVVDNGESADHEVDFLGLLLRSAR